MSTQIQDAFIRSDQHRTRLRRLGYLVDGAGRPWKVPDDLVPLYRETLPDLGADVPWVIVAAEERPPGRPQEQGPPVETGQRIYPRVFPGRLHFTGGSVRLPVAIDAAAIPEYELAWLPGDALVFVQKLLRITLKASGPYAPGSLS